MFLIFDTETTGLPQNYNAPLTDFDNWPRLVQLAWQIHDEKGVLVDVKNFIVKPIGFVIPRGAEKVHGITTDFAIKEGQLLEFVLNEFNKAIKNVTVLVGHNIEFDLNIMGAEFLRKEIETNMFDVTVVDTKEVSTDFCELPGGRGGKFKWPNLNELHQKLFNEGFDAAHNASADVEATARCFLELIRLGIVNASELNVSPAIVDEFRSINTDVFKAIGLNVEPFNDGGSEYKPLG